MRSVVAAVGLIGLLAAGCGPAGPAATPAPARITSGERVAVPGAADVLVAYPETIIAYRADDRGAYVVVLEPGPAGDAVRARLRAGGDADAVGDDGEVRRLTAAEHEALITTAGVRAIPVLQPSERRSAVTMAAARAGGAPVDVRIDLFYDASADEAAAVAAWIAWRGGTVGWRGPTALTATLPADQIGPASRLSPVRWVE